jgi:hypothetical protein
MNRTFTGSKLFVCALALLMTVALTTVGAFSQAISGNVVGVVLDSSGAAVANVDVEVTNVATGVKTTTKTNSTGEYRVNNLPAGSYTFSAKASGFSAATRRADVVLNQTGTVNITLTPGAVSTTVEVSGALPVIDTTTAQLTNNFDQRQVIDTPTVSQGSGVLNLSLYDAGVTSSGGIGAGTGPAVGGQRPRNNNFTIEGVDNNSKSVTGPLASVPNDAVASFSVLQNQFGPEFGHSSGGQFNTIIVSGTNSFHGRAYEYFRNRNLNAIDASSVRDGLTSNPRFDNNRFGGQVGGPIFKNKLFFFFNYEYNPIGQSAPPAAIVSAPTANGYAQLAALGNSISQANLTQLQKWVPAAPVAGPTPIVVAGTNIEVGQLSFVGPSYQNNRASIAAVDYNISQKDQLRGRFIYNKQINIDTAATLPAFYQTAPTISDVFTLGEYHTFSPVITNEFRLGYNRSYNLTPAGDFKWPGLDSFPNVALGDLGINIGPDGNAPQFTYQNVYQLVDNLSWTKGRHTLQFGVEGRKYISPQSFTQRARGDYEYNSTDLFLRDFTPDSIAERSLGNPIYYGDQIALYWYANDTFRIRPNVTLTFGLRHEYTTIPFGERSQKLNSAASVPGLVSFDEPRAPKKNFAPRVGLAWSPGSGNTSIRAGFGMAYDVLYDNIGILSLPPQLSGTIDCPGSPTCPADGVFLASGGIPPSPGGLQTFPDVISQREATANFIPPNQKDPYTISWNLSVQHVFAKDYTAEVRYVGTHGVHLNVQERLNVQSVVTPSNSLPTFLQAPSQATLDALPITRNDLVDQFNAGGFLVPAYANVGFDGNFLVSFQPFGSSVYHGLQTQLTRRFNHGLQFQAAYTWSHNIDNSTADFFTTVLTPRRPEDFQHVGADRSNSALDHRHRFTVTALYDLPFFKGSNRFLKNVIGNWEFAPVYTFESGEFATVQNHRDSNLNADSFTDRALVNPAGKTGTGSDVTPLTNTDGSVVAYLANDPTAQYIRADTGTLGGPGLRLAGRNTLLMPHINNWDFNIVKRMSFTESLKFEFAAQLLNLFNHPQFVPGLLNDVLSFGQTGDPVRTMLTPCNSTGTTCAHGLNPNQPFNRPDQVFNSNARTMQLALKFIF